MWVVKDIKKAEQQPFLEVGKPTQIARIKPNPTAKPATKDDLEAFDEVVKDTEKTGGNIYPLSS